MKRTHAAGAAPAMTPAVTARKLEQNRRAVLRSRDTDDRHHYFSCVAEARFVLRKVFRIVEEQARGAGLDPLEHQVLLQIYGSESMERPIKEIADRLDISPAFASALVTKLVERGFASRERSPLDQRITRVTATAAGVELLQQVDDRVKFHVDYFAGQLTPEQKERAVAILLFYVGLAVHHD